MIRVKTLLIILINICIFRIGYSQTEKKLVLGEQPVYKVTKATGPVTIDGKMNESSWKKAEIQTFDYFYRGDRVPDKQNTKFRMLWDDERIYLFYECEDTFLTAREKNPDAEPYLDDCAEFFCLPIPDSLNIHFAFEVNLYKAAYDFVILYGFNKGRHSYIKSYNPSYEVEVSYEGTLNNDTDKDKGWNMELAIPFSAFSDINSVNPAKAGARWAFQAVRQDRNIVVEKRRSTSTLFPIYDIRKDVHQPSRFGLMEFVE